VVRDGYELRTPAAATTPIAEAAKDTAAERRQITVIFLNLVNQRRYRRVWILQIEICQV
jgi:hypothetical protein